jgi:P4 family phage/plasmid primase-like protien
MSGEMMQDDTLEAALGYAGAGLAVVWLAQGTKRPTALGWTTAPRATPEELRATFKPGMNVGLRCGPVSSTGHGECLCVLDLDVSTEDAEEKAQAWAKVSELVGHSMAKAPTVVSGSGRGRHWYLRWPEGEIQSTDKARVVLATSGRTVPGSAKQTWQIEMLMAGAQAVADPSIHPDTGQPYQFVGDFHAAPVELVEAVRKANSRAKIESVGAGAGARMRPNVFAALPMLAATMMSSASAQYEGGGVAPLAHMGPDSDLAGLSAFATVRESVPDLETMREALAAIPPSIGRAEWLRVLWAVRAHDYPEGESVAREWSMGCVEKWKPADFMGAWGSQSKGPAVEAGTLYHIARQHGWTGSLKRNQTNALSVAAEAEIAPAITLRVDAGAVAPAQPPGSVPDVQGDLSNGVAFAKDWRNRLLYIEAENRWLEWDGGRWTACANAVVMDRAKKTAERLLVEGAAAYSADPASSLTKANMKAAADLYKSDRRLEAMIHMAQSEWGMWERDPSCFDADPLALACPNGLLDLRTGAMTTTTPVMRVQRQTGVAYNPAAPCPQFLRFMGEVFEGDQTMIDYMQRQLGYALTGLVHEEKMFSWYGHGANGKSVLGNVIAGVLGRGAGGYCQQVSSSLLRRDANGSTSAAERATMTLIGARVVQMNELAEGEVWDEAKLKEITSREPITARRLYGEAFEFMPTHKLFVRSNSKPIIKDDSHGTWRRLALCGFNRQWSEGEQDKGLEGRLLEQEGEGILAWLVEGCRKWQAHGLAEPESVRRDTAAYRSDNDIFGQWLAECCDTGDRSAQTLKASAMANYKAWCEVGGYRYPMSMNALTRKLGERGFPRDAGKRFFCGLALRAAPIT